VLRDASREGTWVNDQPVTGPVLLRPGDWIRLGPDGPVLRFLGQSEFAHPHDGGQWPAARAQF
jgi:pSer/pThr/pTyr-binding forkhead associated (FHA) protein